MVNHIYPVNIGPKHYTKEFQREAQYAKSWKSVLEKAYGTTHATCCCPGRGDRKLAIKRREGSDSYHLARFSGTGAEHTNECRFYAPAPESSGMQAYDRGVVEEGEDGLLRIRLARGLRVLHSREVGEEGTVQAPAAPGVRKPAMTLLGLLHLLWQESRLNVWYPAMEGKRSSLVVARAVAKAAARIGTDRVRLADVLLLPAAKDSPAEKANQDTVARAIERSLRLVVVAPLARYDAGKHGGTVERLPLSRPFGMPPLYLQQGQWGRIHQRFRQEISAWIRGGQVMAIAHLDVKMGSKWPVASVLDVAVMPVSEQWIPFDSSYEAVIEARLRFQGRAFEKPLRFDAEEDAVFPDFWLLDVGKTFPMEVFGMATPEYLARKQIKREHYNREYGVDGWWSWNADRDPQAENIPNLPGKSSKQ